MKRRPSIFSSMPMPLSCTENSTQEFSSSCASMRARTDTSPIHTSPLENLMALLSRLIKIWRRRNASPCSSCGICGSTNRVRSTCFFNVTRSSRIQHFSTTSSTEKGVGDSSSLPASILEKSRMSLMMPSRLCADSRAVSAISICCPLRLVCISTSSMPITPFIGVRIS